MREMIFRGIRKDNGKRVEGYYLCLHHQQPDDTELHIIVDEHGGYNPVDPETVGEFTGLTDKNGRKIFEGDIIEIVGEDARSFVRYDSVETEFYMTFDDAYFGLGRDSMSREIEIIGNIHDNIDLLERE